MFSNFSIPTIAGAPAHVASMSSPATPGLSNNPCWGLEVGIFLGFGILIFGFAVCLF